MRRFRLRCLGRLHTIIHISIGVCLLCAEDQGGKGRGRERTRTRIRIQHRNPMLTSTMLEEALLRAIIRSARQAGQVNQQRNFLRRPGLRGEVKVEVHFAFCGGRGMAEFKQFAAEGGDCCFGCDGHFHCQLYVG